MRRITDKFNELAREGKKGFIPFISAGDPDLGVTLELILELAGLGSAVIELGVPFTDPMADGPVIQRSSERALRNGDAGVAGILELVSEARRKTEVPIVLFGYMNPFFRYGFSRLTKDAARAGVNGFLITDVVGRDFSVIAKEMGDDGLDLISLIAPTTTDERLAEIARFARGFVYAVSRTGVTGKGAESRQSARELVARSRKFTDLPVAVGFGISSREDVGDVCSYADAAVVGSAIVSVIERSGSREEVVADVRSFVSELLGGPVNGE